VLLSLVGIGAGVAWFTYPKWQHLLPAAGQKPDDHAGHAGHAGHDDPNAVKLSKQARKNIGLTDEFIQPVKLQPFTRTLTIPGMVVERPGRSVAQVKAPFTGHVTRIYPIEGESVSGDSKLFDLRLTHEDLVQTQADLLQLAAEIDIVDKEVARLEKLISEGTIAGKRALELKYEREKKEIGLKAKRQSLVLHGLSDEQVNSMLKNRELFKEITITVRDVLEDIGAESSDLLFEVQEIEVAQGQHVEAGTTLAVLADHAELYIEGDAFERDVADISRVAEADSPVTAILEKDGAEGEVIENLKVLYVASKLDPEKRTLHFYVTLPNQKQRDSRDEKGRRFFAWKYRPGQRVQLEIPLETLPNRIVLPIDALAQDGAETYVFTPDGDQLERRPVHVEYRDQRRVVIANDGSIFPDELVALKAAQQLQVAVKNKSGGAPDPHAGHSH
jgi:multidrug efflux pump subunit AcrA (membrane-fusion protein)